MAEKLSNVGAEMSQLNTEILGFGKVRWPGSREQKISKRFFSGATDPNCRYGTSIIIPEEIENYTS